MWLSSIGPWLASGGGVAVLALIAKTLHTWHNDAVAAERRRADDWLRAYEHEREARETLGAQLASLLGRSDT